MGHFNGKNRANLRNLHDFILGYFQIE